MDKYDITDYLKDDKELQKAVIDEFLKEIAELEAENERLRTCLDTQRFDETNQYIKKVNVERKNYKLKSTLQEIKEIARKKCDDCDNVDGTTLWDDCEKICELPEIINIINKAEEE